MEEEINKLTKDIIKSLIEADLITFEDDRDDTEAIIYHKLHEYFNK